MQNEIFSDPRGRSEPPARSRTPLSARYRHRNEEECGVTPFQRVSYALNYYKVERSDGLLSFDQTLPPCTTRRPVSSPAPGLLVPRGFCAFRNMDRSANSLLAGATRAAPSIIADECPIHRPTMNRMIFDGEQRASVK